MKHRDLKPILQIYFTPEHFFLRFLSHIFIRDVSGISEKEENKCKFTKVKFDTNLRKSPRSFERTVRRKTTGDLRKYAWHKSSCSTESEVGKQKELKSKILTS